MVKNKIKFDEGEKINSPFTGLSKFISTNDLATDNEQGQESKPKTTRLETQQSNVFANKVILRRTKKGYGGKTVTLIEGILITGSPLKALAKELAKKLGTRVSINEINDASVLVVSGDQRERLNKILNDKGAKYIIQS